jgi:hypothetical protein
MYWRYSGSSDLSEAPLKSPMMMMAASDLADSCSMTSCAIASSAVALFALGGMYTAIKIMQLILRGR